MVTINALKIGAVGIFVILLVASVGSAQVTNSERVNSQNPSEPINVTNSSNSTALTIETAPETPEKFDFALRNHHPNEESITALEKNPNKTISVVVEVSKTNPNSIDKLEEKGVDINLVHQNSIQAQVPFNRIATIEKLSWVKNVRRPFHPTENTVSEGVETINVDQIQELGINGDGVRIGVIDVGFEPDNVEIRNNVEGTKSFTGNITGGDGTHGTAVSEVIVDSAPSSELYLANVNSHIEFAHAVNWLESKDVDIISTSLGYNRVPFDGSSYPSKEASEAVENGTFVVASAGNEALSHWEGQFKDEDRNMFMEFYENDERNHLNGSSQIGGNLSVTLSWNDWPNSNQDLDLYLYRYNEKSDDEIVASSTISQNGDQIPVEYVSITDLPEDHYYIGIKRYGDLTKDLHVEVYANDRTNLEYQIPSSSLTAPATGHNVTGVGAYHYRDLKLEPYSSHGPTNDGRLGVDVAAPTGVTTTVKRNFSGTSAAAPHVAGLATLLYGDNPRLNPSEIEDTLQETAYDIGLEGIDYESGYGSVEAIGALREVNPKVVNFTLQSNTANTGENISGTVWVENSADIDKEIDVSLFNDENLADSVTWHIDSGTVDKAGFNVSFSSSGEHTVSINDLPPKQVTVKESASLNSAKRAIEVDELGPGDSTMVDISVEFNGEREFQIVDQFDSRLSAEIVDGPGNIIGNEVTFNFVGSGTATDQATVTYEVTVPKEAEAGTEYSFDGDVQTDSTNPILGDETITVVNRSADLKKAERSIQRDEIAPGESTKVDISVEFEEEQELQIVDEFDSNLSAEIVHGPGNVVGNEVTWNYVSGLSGTVAQTTVTYEVEVPESAEIGTTYNFNGEVKTANSNVITGDDTILIVDVAWYDNYVNDNGVVDNAGINAAVSDYLSGDIDDSQLNSIVLSYLSGEPFNG